MAWRSEALKALISEILTTDEGIVMELEVEDLRLCVLEVGWKRVEVFKLETWCQLDCFRNHLALHGFNSYVEFMVKFIVRLNYFEVLGLPFYSSTFDLSFATGFTTDILTIFRGLGRLSHL